MILSVRFLLSTAAVLSMAVMSIFSRECPLIWRLVVSWFRPPYLYLVMNCIIVTIFASSKLHQRSNDYTDPIKIFPADDDYYGGGDLVEVTQPPLSPTEIECICAPANSMVVSDEFDLYRNENDRVPESKTALLVNDHVQVDNYNAIVSYSDNGTIESANIEKIDDVINILEHPVNTLEGTWKTIAHGPPMPITLQHTGNGNLEDYHKMIKSDQTFNRKHRSNNRNNMSKTLPRSSGSTGKFRRDPSLSQDELNKRVEAFIDRFKEDMRLQRKESLNRYVKMINSGPC